MNLNHLPRDVFGQILEQLNHVTGVTGFINDCDIPYVAKYAASLACTCKVIALHVTDLDITHLFLQSISKKYSKSCEELAVKINFDCHQRWLWNCIKKNKLDDIYQTIKEVVEIGLKIFREAKDAGFNIVNLDCPTGEPYFQYFQTLGLGLLFNSSSNVYITTPFGRLRFRQEVTPINLCAGYSIVELFIQRLHAQFDKFVNTEFVGSYEDFYQIKASEKGKIRKVDTEDLKPINDLEVSDIKGSKNTIISTGCGLASLYSIGEVNGKAQEITEFKSNMYYKSPKVLKAIWRMLETNYLGLDPILKIENKETCFHQNITDFALFTHISEVLAFAMDIIAKLEIEPVMIGRHTQKDWNIARFLILLNDAVIGLDKASTWHLSRNGPHIHLSNDNKRCDRNALKRAYDFVIKCLSIGWKRSELKDHVNHCHQKKSEEEFVLFVNATDVYSQKYHLMECLIEQFYFQEFVSAHRGCFSGPDYNLTHMYLWIRKDKLAEFLKAFNISL